MQAEDFLDQVGLGLDVGAAGDGGVQAVLGQGWGGVEGAPGGDVGAPGGDVDRDVGGGLLGDGKT